MGHASSEVFDVRAQLANGVTKGQLVGAMSPRFQELIILPTEKCNFRCTYCYEDFAIGRMSDQTQRAIELFVERRVNQLTKLSFSWFGGEPLLAKDVILRLSRFAAQVCRERGVQFKGGLTTNAYLLTKEVAEALLECRQNFFQITLDGWGSDHDKTRRRADGKGTFDVIWGHLKQLQQLKQDFEVCIRVHVRRDNEQNLHELSRNLALHFGSDRRFFLDFEHVRDLGGEGGKTVDRPLTKAELREVETRLRGSYVAELKRVMGANADGLVEQQVVNHADNAGESSGSRGREDGSAPGQPYICYAAKPNSLLIRANGRIGKCTVHFHDERNDLGYIREDGTIAIDNAKLLPWIRGLGTLQPEDLGCPIHHMAPPFPASAKRTIVIQPATA